MIGSSSRLQLINPILEVQIPEEQLETQHTTPKPDKGMGIARDTGESPPKLIKASTKVRPDPDTLVLVLYEIRGKLYRLTEEGGVDPKALSSNKDGQDFLKIQDAEMNVLKRESLEKLTRAKELRKKKD
ncbi:hypothetical protein Tco_0026629 [Tanacetum coccineum]